MFLYWGFCAKITWHLICGNLAYGHKFLFPYCG